jgi:hypothetical protein
MRCARPVARGGHARVIEVRSSGDGLVVEMPLMRILSRAGFTVDALQYGVRSLFAT